MRHIVADCETDNLLDKLTKVHSLVIRDLDSDAVVSCADQPGYVSIAEGLELLKQAERIYFHNGIRFDYPALCKVYPAFTLRRDQIRDTLVIAQMRWAHQKDVDFAQKKVPTHLIGRHSLESWGYRLGVHKGEYKKWCTDNGITDPFAEWRVEMQDYCVGDTATTKALVLHIRKWGVSPESVTIEHELAWYLAQQEDNGWPFDEAKAVALQGKLSARREAVSLELQEAMGPLVMRNGPEFTPKKDDRKKGYVAGCPVQKIKVVAFNPGSRQHIATKLMELYGWKPTEFTPSGQPEVNEATLLGLPDHIPGVKLLTEYLMLDKRLGQLAEGKEAWLRHMRVDARTGITHIYGRVKQSGAVTHRASHSNPNVAQVPKVGSPFGQECRELFHVPKGWKEIGADASGLEARCLGHYMARYDDGAYGRLLLEGDVHTANRVALGLPGDTPDVAKVARDGSKTFFYGFIFGSGDLKSGKILSSIAMPDGRRLIEPPRGGWSEGKLTALGKSKKALFLKQTPAMKYLLDAVKAKTKAEGFLLLPDGRRAYVRSEHSALNTLIQGSGAVICKAWVVNSARRLTETFGEQGWNGQWAGMGFIHDEQSHAVRPDIAEDVGRILVEEIRKLTAHFKWALPLDGDYKVGENWAQTH